MRHAKAVLRRFKSGESTEEIAMACFKAQQRGAWYTHAQIEQVIRRALIRAERRKDGRGRRG